MGGGEVFEGGGRRIMTAFVASPNSVMALHPVVRRDAAARDTPDTALHAMTRYARTH
jgi:hypothetical protein